MPTNNIEGKWQGYYKYGKAYPLEYQAIPVSFMIEITLDENGIIKGKCIDDLITELGIGPASIEGTFENNTIVFMKYYPCLITIDQNNKTVAVHDKPSVGIQYKGSLKRKLFSKNYFLKGEWDISGSLIDERGTAQYYNFDGTWSLRKII